MSEPIKIVWPPEKTFDCVVGFEDMEKNKKYFDEKTNEVKGKCKLKPHKSYFAFEIRDK